MNPNRIFYRRVLGLLGLVVVLFWGMDLGWQNNLKFLIEHSRKNNPDAGAFSRLNYRATFLGIPAGYLYLENQSPGVGGALSVQMRLRPWWFLQKLSGDRVGFNFISTFNPRSYLPVEFVQSRQHEWQAKKKIDERIVYHHAELMMERREYQEDILPDTRDLVSLGEWLMHQDYAQNDFVKSTLNMRRKIFLVLGKVKERRSLFSPEIQIVYLRLKFVQLDRGYQIVQVLPMDVYFFKKEGWYLPLRFSTGALTFVLDEN